MNANCLLHTPRTRSIRIEWIVCAALAVFGSLFYGASLRLDSGSSHAAAAITVSAGVGWIVFGLCFLAVARPPLVSFVHACLVTMVVGEAVLAGWALLNHAGLAGSVGFNIGVVALSNIVMAAVLSRRLLKIGVPLRVTLSLWMLVLNGTGFAVFCLFYPEIL